MSNAMMKIRPMVEGDKAAIMRILHRTPEFNPEELIVAEEVLDSYLEDPSGSGYYAAVAEADGSVDGYVCWGPAPMTEGTWDLYWAAVAPDKQGRGVGGALISFAEDSIREAGGRLALIETSSKPDYDRIRRFHRYMGYEEACRVPDYYAPGDDKLILRKLLNQST